jgi:4'-phosphopantetheinyl transferase superfamily
MSSDERRVLSLEPTLEIWFATRMDEPFELGTLRSEEQARYCSLRSPRKRKEFELSRALLQRFGLTKSVSISHSGGCAALARCTEGLVVGLDMEVHKPRDVLSLARFAFHADELAALSRHARPLDLFYELWVLKEACAKALKLQLIDALQQCVFRFENNAVIGTLPTSLPWRAFVWRVREDVSLGAVVLGAERPPLVRQTEWPAAASASWPQTVVAVGDGAIPP